MKEYSVSKVLHIGKAIIKKKEFRFDRGPDGLALGCIDCTREFKYKEHIVALAQDGVKISSAPVQGTLLQGTSWPGG